MVNNQKGYYIFFKSVIFANCNYDIYRSYLQIAVFNHGICKGLNGTIPIGGHKDPCN